jgi:hypothetical protein
MQMPGLFEPYRRPRHWVEGKHRRASGSHRDKNVTAEAIA